MANESDPLMFQKNGTFRISPAEASDDDARPDDRLLRAVIRASRHCILLLRAPDYTVVDASEGYFAATGLSRQIVGRKFLSMVAELRTEASAIAMEALSRSLENVRSTGKADVIPLLKSDFPVESSGSGSRERYWSITNTPISEAGEVRLILSEATDVTDLHQLRRLLMSQPAASSAGLAPAPTDRLSISEAQQVLDTEGMRLLQLFQQSPGFVAVLHGPTHIVTFTNASHNQLVGHRDILGKPLAEAVPELITHGYLDLLDGVYRTGRAFIGRNMQAGLQRTPGGEREKIYIDLLYQPILDEDGSVNGIFIHGTDVTERKLAEDSFRRANETLEQRIQERTAQLLASQEQLRILFENSTEYHGVVRALDNGDFVYEEVNPAALKLMGRPREEVIGRPTHEVIGSEFADIFDAHARQCLRLGKPVRYERVLPRSVIDVVVVPVVSNFGKPTRIIITARDVTDSRMLEAQLRQAQKMEAVGQLTGGIAHDFNNLLTVIIGNLDRLERRLSDPALQTSASMALESARKAATLTHRLLAFSRKQPLEPKAIDVNLIIADMSEILKRTLGETIVVETILDPKLWTTSADPNQVENALLNLALNARDAMPGGGRLSIYTANVWLEAMNDPQARQMTPGEYVRISVRDTGIGMPPDVLARAFEPFFTTKEVGQGSGLGLPMIYGFIKQSGGHVNIESEVGAGTTVNVYLPRLYEIPQEVPVELQPARRRLGRKRILAVEDDAAVRHYTVTALEDMGHEVLAAADAPEALRFLEEVRADLLFTDLVLPGGINGRELARAARQLRPDLKVLFTTGYDRGMLDAEDSTLPVLPKPFTVEQLNARIAAVFEVES